MNKTYVVKLGAFKTTVVAESSRAAILEARRRYIAEHGSYQVPIANCHVEVAPCSPL